MADISQSWHFVSDQDLPVVDAREPVHKVFNRLAVEGKGGFILAEEGSPRHFVRANVLAEKLVTDGRGDAQRLRTLSEKPISSLVTAAGKREAVVRLPTRPIPLDADEGRLRNQRDAVFRVNAEGQPVGWYLNHETVRGIMTERTWFICSGEHRNPDPDHGTCYKCPNPIVRSERG